MNRWELAWAARFIKPFEGCELRAYQDSGGIWTIGYGHIKNAHPGMVISQDQADAFLVRDLRSFAKEVDRLVTRKMSVRQRIAFISLAFNIGASAFASSTALRRFNDGDVAGAAEALTWWNKDARGTVLLGLQRRRRAEKWLLLHKGRSRRKVRRTVAHSKAHRYPLTKGRP